MGRGLVPGSGAVGLCLCEVRVGIQGEQQQLQQGAVSDMHATDA